MGVGHAHGLQADVQDGVADGPQNLLVEGHAVAGRAVEVALVGHELLRVEGPALHVGRVAVYVA